MLKSGERQGKNNVATLVEEMIPNTAGNDAIYFTSDEL